MLEFASLARRDARSGNRGDHSTTPCQGGGRGQPWSRRSTEAGWTSLGSAAAVVTVAALALASCTTISDNHFRDKSRKGYLVIVELKEASPEAYKAANRKGDGRLTLQEYVNALFIDFDKADTDKDGSLTFEEIEVYSRTTGR